MTTTDRDHEQFDERIQPVEIGPRTWAIQYAYTIKNVLHDEKRLHVLPLELHHGDTVQAVFSASARGEFGYSIVAEPEYDMNELLSGNRVLQTLWPDSGNFDAGWFPISTLAVFRSEKAGAFRFRAILTKEGLSGRYAIHRETLVVRVVGTE